MLMQERFRGSLESGEISADLVQKMANAFRHVLIPRLNTLIHLRLVLIVPHTIHQDKRHLSSFVRENTTSGAGR
jgi:hypothetical protein